MKYRRRKKKDASEGKEVITEPARRSIYDVLQTNLKIAKRGNYIHRIIYIGEYNLRGSGDLAVAMEENYKLTNTGYATEHLSGVLLYYPSYFCYIVEGSEEVLHKHFTLLIEHEDEHLENVKLLAAVHHVKSRFLNDWMCYYGRPSERVEEIDPESDLDNSMRYVTECCEKMYNFANAFITDQMHLRARAEAIAEGEDDQEEVPPTVKYRSRSIVERDVYTEHLPEIKLLHFLTHCKYLKTLKQYHRYYEYIGQSTDYSLKSWPAPKNFVPYDVFDEVYDPISDLPRKEGEETPKGESELVSVDTGDPSPST